MTLDEYERMSMAKLKASPVKNHVGEKSFPVYSVQQLVNLNPLSFVTESKALGLEAFFSCVQDQSGAIGALPLKMYRTEILDDRPKRVYSGREFNIFTERPCEFMSMQEFIEMLVVSYRTNGAFYALPVKDDKNRIIELIPFFNQNSVREQHDYEGNVYVTYTTNSGKTVGPIASESLFIVKNFTLDGYTPVRPLTYQAQLLGMAVNQEENYANLQNEGITSQMALSTDGLFDNNEARNRLKEDFNKFRGPQGHKEIPIFEQGLKPVNLKLTPQEMDLLNQREFTVKRICAVTQTMPHRIGAETIRSSDKIYDLDEAQFKKWQPLLVKIENELSRIAGRYLTVRFNRKAFYAGSPARLVEAVEREVKGGLASIAEGREDLGRDYIPDTENIFCIESNNCTYGSWDELKNMRMTEGRNNGNDNENVSD